MPHGFTFTPSISLFVHFSSEEELCKSADALSKAEGSRALMPLDKYDFADKFGWINDQFGVSWQLMFNKSK